MAARRALLDGKPRSPVLGHTSRAKERGLSPDSVLYGKFVISMDAEPDLIVKASQASTALLFKQ